MLSSNNDSLQPWLNPLAHSILNPPLSSYPLSSIPSAHSVYLPRVETRHSAEALHDLGTHWVPDCWHKAHIVLYTCTLKTHSGEEPKHTVNEGLLAQGTHCTRALLGHVWKHTVEENLENGTKKQFRYIAQKLAKNCFDKKLWGWFVWASVARLTNSRRYFLF